MPRKSAATLAAEKAAADAKAAQIAAEEKVAANEAAPDAAGDSSDDAPTDTHPADPAGDAGDPDVTSAADAIGDPSTAHAGLPPETAAAVASQGGPEPVTPDPAPEPAREPGDHKGELVVKGASSVSFPDGTEWAVDEETGLVTKRLT